MAKTKKQYQSPFGERRTFSSPQGLRKHIDANYAKEAKATNLYDNPRWMDALIVDGGGKPAGQAQTSTRRRTTGHRKQRAMAGQQSGTVRSGRRQVVLNYRELTNQQLINAYQESGREIQRRREELNSLSAAIQQQEQQGNRTMTAGSSGV